MAHPGGRPLTFPTAEDLLYAFAKYQSEFEEGGSLVGEIPDVESFCVYIDSYRNLLNEYESKDEFSGAIKKIKNWIYYKKKQLAMVNKMPAAIFIFDAKNNFGYVEKTEVDQNISGELKTGEANPELAKKFSEFLKGKR